jgi:hypothetical protein
MNVEPAAGVFFDRPPTRGPRVPRVCSLPILSHTPTICVFDVEHPAGVFFDRPPTSAVCSTMRWRIHQQGQVLHGVTLFSFRDRVCANEMNE